MQPVAAPTTRTKTHLAHRSKRGLAARFVRWLTTANTNESRDWRIWSDLAALLIRRARKLYANDALGVDLDNTVYALDSSTIDLCLSLLDWAPFLSTKAAIVGAGVNPRLFAGEVAVLR